MQELWLPIKGFESSYLVSNTGKIKSIDRIIDRGFSKLPLKGKLLSPGNNSGYLYVILSKGKISKTVQIHRIVAETFIPNPNNLPCVNHKDENTLNNCVDNLEWCTKSYNNSYKEARIKAAIKFRKPILQYSKNGEFIKEWTHAGAVEKELGINARSIYECCKGRCKTSGGYIWKRK